MLANKVLKKFKRQYGDFIFSKSSTWRSSALEELMRPVNEERNLRQYNNLLVNCEIQYLKLINLYL